jgi:hypothetical protein
MPWDNLATYVVTAQILVDNVAGERGVYWSATPPAYKTSATTTCGTAPGGLPFAGVGQTYYRGDGTTVVAPAALVVAGPNNCAAVAAAGKAVSFTTTATALFAAGDFFFELNLPPFVYNLAEVAAGQTVSVRVTLTKATCGSWSMDMCIGSFIATCPTALGAGGMRLCPYVTGLNAADALVSPNWWNGIAIVNTSATAGTVTLTAVKADGSANATFTTPSLAPGGQYAKMLPAIPWVGTTPAGVPAYITVQGAAGVTTVDAFVMMSNSTHDSMGYLCR